MSSSESAIRDRYPWNNMNAVTLYWNNSIEAFMMGCAIDGCTISHHPTYLGNMVGTLVGVTQAIS